MTGCLRSNALDFADVGTVFAGIVDVCKEAELSDASTRVHCEAVCCIGSTPAFRVASGACNDVSTTPPSTLNRGDALVSSREVYKSDEISSIIKCIRPSNFHTCPKH